MKNKKIKLLTIFTLLLLILLPVILFSCAKKIKITVVGRNGKEFKYLIDQYTTLKEFKNMHYSDLYEEGFTLTGFSNKTSSDIKLDEFSPIEKNLKIYAKYSQNYITITLYSSIGKFLQKDKETDKITITVESYSVLKETLYNEGILKSEYIPIKDDKLKFKGFKPINNKKTFEELLDEKIYFNLELIAQYEGYVDITLSANNDKNEFQDAKFVDFDNKNEIKVTVKYNEKLQNADLSQYVPKIPGFSFTGFYLKNNKDYKDVLATEDIVLYSTYKIVKQPLLLDFNGGKYYDVEKLVLLENYNTNLNEISYLKDIIPEKEGCKFIGFSLNKKDPNDYLNHKLKEDVVLTALYKKNKYSITLEAVDALFEDGTNKKIIEIEYNENLLEKINEIEKPKKEHYSIISYTFDNDVVIHESYKVKENIKVKINFTNNKTLKINGFDVNIEDIEYNTKLTDIDFERPQKEGYKLIGYKVNSESELKQEEDIFITEDTILEPIFEINKYNVEIFGFNTLENVEYNKNLSDLTFEKPTKEFHKLIGYKINNEDPIMQENEIIIKSDLIIYPIFEINKYNVEIDGIKTLENVEHNTVLSDIYEDPIKDGYKFIGYKIDDENIYQANEIIITSNIVLHPQFIEIFTINVKTEDNSYNKTYTNVELNTIVKNIENFEEINVENKVTIYKVDSQIIDINTYKITKNIDIIIYLE